METLESSTPQQMPGSSSLNFQEYGVCRSDEPEINQRLSITPGNELLACHDCDLLQHRVNAPAGAAVRCRRCGSVLYRHSGKPLEHSVAWSVAGLILLLLANVFPVVNLSVNGLHTEATLFSGAIALSRAGQFSVAALVIGVLIVAPALLFVLQIVILQALRRNRLVPRFVLLMRILSGLGHWLMFDVFMLAIIVAVVKLSHLADVSVGEGLWAFLGLMVASIVSVTSYDVHELWRRYSSLSRRKSGFSASEVQHAPHPVRTRPTALSRGLVNCPACGLLSHWHSGTGGTHCPRCDASLHLRKTDSLSRTWALLIAGYILFVPANLLPITITTSLFGTQSDTIMSSVAYFWNDGAYDLAIVIFTASIFVPLLKLLSLTYLTYTAHKRMHRESMQRTRLFRLVEFVGKWSMLDIFVLAMLAQLVQFSTLASIEAGPGAIAFAAVVVVTMLAALSFDPRLLWDPLEKNRHSGEIRG